jgi:hypothetical protein
MPDQPDDEINCAVRQIEERLEIAKPLVRLPREIYKTPNYSSAVGLS